MAAVVDALPHIFFSTTPVVTVLAIAISEQLSPGKRHFSQLPPKSIPNKINSYPNSLYSTRNSATSVECDWKIVYVK